MSERTITLELTVKIEGNTSPVHLDTLLSDGSYDRAIAEKVGEALQLRIHSDTTFGWIDENNEMFVAEILAADPA